jgi:hypothetical protein
MSADDLPPVRDAVIKGRSRAAPFSKPAASNEGQPPPGALVYMDFAGPLIESVLHRFTCYCGTVDAGSGYGRVWPDRNMTAPVASSAIAKFVADVASKMGFNELYKPAVVRSDKGSAFISNHFREFLADRQIHLTYSAEYTPQQNSHIERFWGIVFGTARVLLAAANLPPTFHPFAMQAAAWITNRLPRPSRGGNSPLQMLSHRLPDISYLYAFGCLCAAVLPTPRRVGDRHFADRGEYGLYLGPSEESPAHVVYLLSSRRVITAAKIRVWEDQFPGIKGNRFVWFNDMPIGDVTDDAGTNPPVIVSSVSNNVDSSSPADADVLPETPTPVNDRSGRITDVPGPAPPDDPGIVTPVLPSPPSAPPAQPRRSGRLAGDQLPQTIFAQRAYSQPCRSRAIGAFLMLASAMTAHTVISPGFAYDDCTAPVGNGSGIAESLGADAECADDLIIDAAVHAHAVTITSDLGDVRVPKTYQQALASPHANYWREAINKELAGLIALETWTCMPESDMPPGSNLMHCHFVFAVKRKADGSIEKFKARLVADGNTQKFGVDFDRIFSSVVKTVTIRLVLAIAAARDYNLSSIDVRQAYLQASLNRDLYMRVPPGLPRYTRSGARLVCKLLRSLYGLRQAGREWAELLTSFLLQWGFVRSDIDVCLYVYATGADILWVLVYVDDALIVDNSPPLRRRFVGNLANRFPIEDKGDLSWILNVGISRDRARRTLTMSQSLYVSDMLQRYSSYVDVANTRHFAAPLNDKFELDPADSPSLGSAEHAAMAPRREAYMGIVGGILWLANMSRPDLAYAASQLSRFMTNPGPAHFAATIRVLTYLRDSADRHLRLTPNDAMSFDTFVDSDWGSNFSCSGGLFFYHGCPVHWFSKMQRSVSLSSAEAEFFGAMLAAKEVAFIRELLVDLGIAPAGPSPIFSDSKSAVNMSFDPVAFKKTKHILRAAAFLRDLVAKGVVVLHHVKGAYMMADILTKPTARAIFIRLLHLLDAYSVDGLAVLHPPASANI